MHDEEHRSMIHPCRLTISLIQIGRVARPDKGVESCEAMATPFDDSGRATQVVAANRSMVHPCRFTISLIQIGAKGDVQPLEQG